MCKLFLLFADLRTFWKQKLSLNLRDMKYIHSHTFSMKMLIFILMKRGNKGADITLHYGTCVITTQDWLMRKQTSCKDYSFKWIVLRGDATALVSEIKKCVCGIDCNGKLYYMHNCLSLKTSSSSSWSCHNIWKYKCKKVESPKSSLKTLQEKLWWVFESYK
jgi:hypothetical protein